MLLNGLFAHKCRLEGICPFGKYWYIYSMYEGEEYRSSLLPLRSNGKRIWYAHEHKKREYIPQQRTNTHTLQRAEAQESGRVSG